MKLLFSCQVTTQHPRPGVRPGVKPLLRHAVSTPLTRPQVQCHAGHGKTDISNVPWGFGFQVNERFLEWDDAAAVQLIKMHLSDKLSLSVEEVEERLVLMGKLVPDMINKLPRMRADILLQLITDPAATTRHLLGLKELLPGINISLLVTRWPFILTDFTLDSLKERLEVMRQQLPGVRLDALIDMEPQLLKVDIPQVLANIKRIMPGHEPISILLAQPQMVLDMQQAGMSSALDVEGVPSKPNP